MTGFVVTAIPFLLGIVATVLAFIFFVPEKRRPRMGKFGKFLHDTLNFKYLIIEKIMQALYIFATAFVIIAGFCMLFYVEQSYGWYSSSTWYGGYGILLMLFGPIAVRIAYELMMMFILLIKNVIQINNKLKNNNEDNGQASAFGMPNMADYTSPAEAPVNPVEPVYMYRFCNHCGNPLNPDGSCPNCGQ